MRLVQFLIRIELQFKQIISDHSLWNCTRKFPRNVILWLILSDAWGKRVWNRYMKSGSCLEAMNRNRNWAVTDCYQFDVFCQKYLIQNRQHNDHSRHRRCMQSRGTKSDSIFAKILAKHSERERFMRLWREKITDISWHLRKFALNWFFKQSELHELENKISEPS